MIVFGPTFLSTINLFVIVMLFVLFTVMEDKIDAFVLEIMRQMRKNQTRPLLGEGERFLNFWLFIGTICMGTIWLMREQVTADFNELILRQQQAEELLTMQIHLMANMAKKVIYFEQQLKRALNRRSKQKRKKPVNFARAD